VAWLVARRTDVAGRVFAVAAVAALAIGGPCFAEAGPSGSYDVAGEAWADATQDSVAASIAFMIAVVVIKVTALILGYLIVRLGHDTMIKGVTGDIDFGFSGSGVSTKLKSGSPGALFVLAGAAVIIWALWVEKPFEAEVASDQPQQVADEPYGCKAVEDDLPPPPQ